MQTLGFLLPDVCWNPIEIHPVVCVVSWGPLNPLPGIDTEVHICQPLRRKDDYWVSTPPKIRILS